MKKILIFLCATLLFSCNENSTSISSSEPLSFNEYLNTLQNSYKINTILENKESNILQGNQSIYLSSLEEKAYGIASLSFEEDNIQVGTMENYFADEKGFAYQEVLTPLNQIDKNYFFNYEQKVKFDTTFKSVFSLLQNEKFIEKENNQYVFSNNQTLNDFAQQFITGEYEITNAYFTFNQEQLSFYLDSSNFTFSINVVDYGKQVKIQHLSPLSLDSEEKVELQNAINELKTNYLVTHYRTNYKTKIYYMDQTILFDDSANGLSSQDSYYYYQENENKMTRLVFGKKYVVGSYSWDENNYQDMLYSKVSFNDLTIRLNSINLGFFKDNHDGSYTSIEGAASILFPYCQPAMNVRQDFVNKALDVTIELKEGHIYKIKLRYMYNPYGGEGYDRTDTILFEQIGNVSLPSTYYNSLNLNNDVILPNEVQGVFKGQVEDKNIKLTLFDNCQAIYEVNDVKYNISKVNYSLISNQIEIGFNYLDEKRSVALVYNPNTNSLEGSDSSLENIFEDFFNMDLFKTEI